MNETRFRACCLVGQCLAVLLTAAGVAAPSGPAIPRVRVVVDPRIELMTIVFRLAGNVEYSYCEVASYAKDVDAHFGRFKNHPAIVRARELHETRHVSFGDPAVLAINLTGLPELAERVPLDPFPSAHTHWTTADARAFLADLRAFARDADVAGFLAAHEPLYRAAIDRLDGMVRRAGLDDWLGRFFRGEGEPRYVIAINLLSASGSLGGMRVPSLPQAGTPRGKPDQPASEDFYVVLGAAHVDADGLPAFPVSDALTIVHEIAHTHVSPVVRSHLSQLMPAANAMYPLVQDEMVRQAYGPGETIIHESLVRACSVRYATSQEGAEAGRRHAAMERERGFLAVPKLAGLLGEYEKDPVKYPTLAGFGARIVAFFDEYSRAAAVEMAAMRTEQRAKLASGTGPKVASMAPANGAEDVDASSVTSLAVTFDRPMRHMAIVQVPGAASPRFTGRPTYDASGRVLTIPCQLEPGTVYAIQLNSEKNMVMTDAEGNQLAPVLWRFRTRK